jgi:hypothetical protein
MQAIYELCLWLDRDKMMLLAQGMHPFNGKQKPAGEKIIPEINLPGLLLLPRNKLFYPAAKNLKCDYSTQDLIVLC